MSYVTMFRKWWTKLQPLWRNVNESWPLPREERADENWETVARGGASGMYTVMIGLGWWVEKASSPALRGELASVIEDVSWVIQTVVKGVEEKRSPLMESLERRNKSINKRASTGAKPNPKKRYIRLLLRSAILANIGATESIEST